MADGGARSNRAGGIDVVVQRTFGPAALEAALTRFARCGPDDGGPDQRPGRGSARWFERWRDETVTFDMSQVEFADFASLGHLALLVEGLVRHGAAVEVCLPVPFAGERELHRLDAQVGDPSGQREIAAALRTRVQARSAALRFIRRAGFEDAVRCRHLPGADRLARVVEGGPPSLRLEDVFPDDEPDPAAAEVGPAVERSLPIRVLPLQWLPPWASHEERTVWERDAAQVLDLKSLMLTAGEARAFSELLVRELVENVHAHAAGDTATATATAGSPESPESPAALVGAVFIEEPAARAFEIGARPAVSDHFAELVSSRTSVVRLVVGDGGVGFEATQGPRFPRRLGAAGRGQPRGLASVRRLVRENHGSLLFRSGGGLGGVVYGSDGVRRNVAETDQAWAPGTFVDVTLAFRAAARAGTTAPSPGGPGGLVASGTQAPAVGLVALQLTGGDQAIDMAAAARDLHEELRSAPGGFLVASLPVVEMSDRTAERLFDQVLVLAGRLPRGSCLVLLAPASSGSRLFPQARAYDDRRGHDPGRRATPVMLRDERGRTAWLGAGRVKGRLLAHLTAQAGRRSGRGAVAGALGLATATVRAATTELVDWIDQGPDGVALRVTPATVDAALPELLRRRLDRALARPAVARHGGFLTPTVERVSMWLDGPRLIEELGGNHLVGYTLATLVRALHPQLDLDGAVLVRLGTTYLPNAFAWAFGDTLGLKRKIYRLSGEVGRYDDLLFAGQATPVVLLTDVIVSGNTARGAAVDLLRQGADPRLLVALVDYGRLSARDLRVEPSPLVVTLAQVDNPTPPAGQRLTTPRPGGRATSSARTCRPARPSTSCAGATTSRPRCRPPSCGRRCSPGCRGCRSRTWASWWRSCDCCCWSRAG